ncbi:MAG: sigma 54-interacting transcriptional regulator [Planctomycetota bacterium]|jgi:transcriptional regulator with GAF, ATPase, and Fis domain/serine/threonine protein kinase/tetratricopeptide (TPR) repeat protein
MTVETPYEMLEILGRGSFASVHLGRHKESGSLAAIKVLIPSGDPEAGKVLLAAEAETLSGLPPGVGPVLLERGEDYLVLEYVKGRDLTHLGPAPPDLAADVARQLAFTLRKLHDSGFLHGDLSPSHVVFTPQGTVRLLDYSFAHPKGRRPSLRLGGAGTPAYVSPEAAAGRFGDPRSDLYAAGAVLYELLTGSPPFVGVENSDSLKARAQQLPESPSRIVAGIPRVLDELILTLLQPKEANRYPDAAAFENAAVELAASGDIGRFRRKDPTEFILSPQEIEEVLALYFSGDLDRPRGILLRGGFGSGRSRMLEEIELAFRPFGVPVLSLGDESAPPSARTSSETVPVYLFDADEAEDEEWQETLARRIAGLCGQPFLLICTSGPTSATSTLEGKVLPEGLAFEGKSIPPLGSSQIERLARSMVGFAELPTAFARLVSDCAKGNPGRAVATVRDLADVGILVRTGASWEIHGELPSSPPRGVNGSKHLAGTALDFEGPMRRMLEAVAVMEDGATEGRLRKIVGLKRSEFDKAFDAAVSEGFLRKDPHPVFADPVCREAFWDALPPGTKADLHGAAAAALRWEKTLEASGWRGVHLLRSGEMEDGSKVLLDAAEEALLQGKEELASHWVQEVVGADRAGTETDARAKALEDRLKEVPEEGEPTSVADKPLATRDLAGLRPGPAQSSRLTSKRTTRPRVRSRVELLLLLARAYVGEGRFASAEETLGTALLEAEKYERRDIVAKAHLLLGKMYLERRDFRQALKNLERAIRDASETQIILQLEGLLLLTRARFETGDAPAALGQLLRARELSGRSGSEEFGVLLTALESEITAGKGEPGRALMNLGRALRAARRTAPHIRAWVRRAIGRTLKLSGEFERAGRYLRDASRSFLEAGEGLSAAAVHLQRGICAAFGGDPAGAEEGVERAVQIFGNVPPGGLRRIAATLRGLGALARGDLSEAGEALSDGERAGGRPEDDLAGWSLLKAAQASYAFHRRESGQAIRRGDEAIRLLDREAFQLLRGLTCRFLVREGEKAAVSHPETVAGVTRWAEKAKEIFSRAGLKAPAGQARVKERELRETISSPVKTAPPPAASSAVPAGETTRNDPGPLSARVSELEAQRESLLALRRISETINSELDLGKLIPLIMDMAIDAVQAERGFLLLEGEGGELGVEVARKCGGEDVGEPESEVSRSIAEEVVRRGDAILTEDAGADTRFSEKMSVVGLRLRSVLCVPLRRRVGALGAVYVEDRRAASAFVPEDMDFLMAFADQAAIALENARLVDSIRLKSRDLEVKTEEIEALNLELYGNIVGESEAMRRVFEILDRATDSQVPVLIEGESGTGKELVARAVHNNGPRKDMVCAVENCAALSESLLESELFGHARGAFTGAVEDRKGIFEVADGGSVFLDEVGEMSLSMQSKLLRVLQDGEFRPVGGKETKKVDVRPIYASNRNLRELVEDGKFREDLFYRMNVLTVKLPPLRDRIEDVPLLVDHFLAREAEGGRPDSSVSAEALKRLMAYRWPGNVRELENEIRRAAALSDGVIGPEHLSPAVTGKGEAPAEIEGDMPPGTLKEHVELLEVRMIRQALAQCEGNRTRAAELLGLSRYGLLKKMRRYGLN